MAFDYQYWRHKKTGETFAIKLKDGRPLRKCGPLKPAQFAAADGRLLALKLDMFHYDRRFEEDPYHYVLCEEPQAEEPSLPHALFRRKTAES